MAELKLLIVTQAVDLRNPVLGFFHSWIEKLAKHNEQVITICLEKGKYHLPDNVKVLSLGKETGASRLKYLWRFYKYLWQERNNYNAVFVHMNQEYVLLAGWWWRLTGKVITLWRNHHSGSWLTDLAAIFCHYIFCPSHYSYTAKYSKTVFMPVGIDTKLFQPLPEVTRLADSILFLARISPTKRPHLLIQAARYLKQKGLNFSVSIYGAPQPADQQYYQSLRQQVSDYDLIDRVIFFPALANFDTPQIYSRHYLCANLSSSGMYDKTIFEAMACGCLSLSSNKNLFGRIDSLLLYQENNLTDLTEKLTQLLRLDPTQAERLRYQSLNLVQTEHSLDLLAKKLSQTITSSL